MSVIDSSKESPFPLSDCVGSYEADNGVRVSIQRGAAINHAEKKATQLAALLQLTHGADDEGFKGYAAHIQDSVLWLASDLASELKELLPLVDADAMKRKNGGAV